DLRYDAGSFDVRRADACRFAVLNQENSIKFNGFVRLTLNLLDVNRASFRYPVLLATGLYDSVHGGYLPILDSPTSRGRRPINVRRFPSPGRAAWPACPCGART